MHYMFGKPDKMDVRCNSELVEATRVAKNGHKEGKEGKKSSEGTIATSFLKEQQGGTLAASGVADDCNKSKSSAAAAAAAADPDYCRRILVRGRVEGKRTGRVCVSEIAATHVGVYYFSLSVCAPPLLQVPGV